MAKRVRRCPACGGQLLWIAYGMPIAETPDLEEEGIALGGCCILGDGRDATHTCSACDRRFFSLQRHLYAEEVWLHPQHVREESGALCVSMQNVRGKQMSVTVTPRSWAYPWFKQAMEQRASVRASGPPGSS